MAVLHLETSMLINRQSDCILQGLGCILSDEMGLGKTIQTLAALSKISTETSYSHLIICPLSLMNQWKEEVERYFDNMSCTVLMGDQEERKEIIKKVYFDRIYNEQYIASPTTLLIVSYQTIMTEIKFFKTREWGVVVVDEAMRY